MARTWLNPHPSSEVRPQDQWWARDPVEVDGAGVCVCAWVVLREAELL